MIITLVAGARPNFMKIAPIIDAIEFKNKQGYNIQYRLVHTGQHYDKNLSGTFFEELNIPLPHVNLDVKSGTQAEQTAAIMIGFEKELVENPCDLVLVVGDVTSTMACAIVAKKAHIKVAHVEAGIRSGDLKMPEEINRMVTDSITDYFFTTSVYANENLEKLGVSETDIFYVGNVMIDTLLKHIDNFRKPDLWNDIGLKKGKYIVMTMHRPSNVDEENKLKQTLAKIDALTENYPIIFPIHPRTKKLLDKLNIALNNLHCTSPLGYLEFNYLVQNAKAVITDSGGITEETTVMNIPCITLRNSTERPETCEIGTNVLVDDSRKKLDKAFENLMSGNWKKGNIPHLWDGKSAERIINHIVAIYNEKHTHNN